MRAALALLLALPLLTTAADKPSKKKPAKDGPVKVKLGMFSAEAPAEWKSQKPANRLRSYQFLLAGKQGGPGDAELIILPESNPKPEKVFPRYKASIVPPEGKSRDDVIKHRKIEGVPGATIDVLDALGTWRYKARPFDPQSKTELKDNYRVVWVIVNDDDEACHLRLSGPKETVDKYYPSLEKLLKALKKTKK